MHLDVSVLVTQFAEKDFPVAPSLRHKAILFNCYHVLNSLSANVTHLVVIYVLVAHRFNSIIRSFSLFWRL